jgi:hypothetical protein
MNNEKYTYIRALKCLPIDNVRFEKIYTSSENLYVKYLPMRRLRSFENILELNTQGGATYL